MEEVQIEDKTVKKVKAKEIKQVSLEQVPTEFGLAFQLPDGSQVSQPEYLVWLGNLMLELKTGMIG